MPCGARPVASCPSCLPREAIAWRSAAPKPTAGKAWNGNSLPANRRDDRGRGEKEKRKTGQDRPFSLRIKPRRLFDVLGVRCRCSRGGEASPKFLPFSPDSFYPPPGCSASLGNSAVRRTELARKTMVKPVKSRLMPTKRPIAHNPEIGH